MDNVLLVEWAYCEVCRQVHATELTFCTQQHAWTDLGVCESRKDAIEKARKLPDAKFHD